MESKDASNLNSTREYISIEKRDEMSLNQTRSEKTEMMDKVWSVVILCLEDKTIREVSKNKTTIELWIKLGSLYMIKSLAHKLYLKQ